MTQSTSDKKNPPMGESQSTPPVSPLKPRPWLFALLSLVLVLLLAGLLALYFKTVYPNREQPHVTEMEGK